MKWKNLLKSVLLIYSLDYNQKDKILFLTASFSCLYVLHSLSSFFLIIFVENKIAREDLELIDAARTGNITQVCDL